MSFWSDITRLVKDPPPSHMFELSEAGLAWAHGGQIGFERLEPGALQVSPVTDNLVRPELVSSALARIAPVENAKKRRPAAILLPDQAARISVLDFDSFPSSAEEQLSLVRFRVKKTVPFDIDSAAVSYFSQPASGSKEKVEVVAAIVALEVLARYEALFRNAGFHPGEITLSALAALNLYRGPETAVLAKLAGLALTVMVIRGGQLKLYRCLPLEEASDEEILGVLHPTFAYVEDELGEPTRKLILCGFDHIPEGLPTEVEPLRSRLGTPGPYNAGLLGYLEGNR